MPDDLAAWVRDEQRDLWDDLDTAIRHASNGTWSTGAENLAYRIARVARLVGPTPWVDVPWTLHAGGLYAALLDVAGVPVEEPSEDEWRRLDERMARHGGTRAELLRRYAGTVDAIRSSTGEICGGE